MKDLINQKAVITQYGGPKCLKITNCPLPAYTNNQVLIKVLRAGVAYGDTMSRKGMVPFQKGKIPGFDVVGEIIKTGSAVKNYKKGDLVGSLTISNGYSSYLAINETELIKIDKAININDACAVILNYTTAYQILKRHAKIKPGSVVFVQGLSGGLGDAFLDLKDIFGVKLFGTASKVKHASVIKKNGTAFDYREDYQSQFLSIEPNGADLVIDGIGGSNFSESFSILNKTGHLVGIGYSGNTLCGFIYSFIRLLSKNLLPGNRKASFYSIVREKIARPYSLIEDLEEVMNLLNNGKIKPTIYGVLPLSEIAEAHKLLEEGKVSGKLILKVNDLNK